MKFSQRIGVTPVNVAIQTSGMSDDLRNSLWNVLDVRIWSRFEFLYDRVHGGLGEIRAYSKSLWFGLLKLPLDTRPDNAGQILKSIRQYFFGGEWHEVYDFIEFTLRYMKNARLIEDVNFVLERELIPVTDEQEIKAIEEALEMGAFKGVVAHLKQAMDHLSRKQSPDYRNSIKESISAVESMAREVTKNEKASLGDALALIEKAGAIHPALKKGLSALYGYTSDENGIRHAMLEEPKISATDAKFMLVACAAFINYLKGKM